MKKLRSRDVEIGRHLREPTGHERLAVAIDEKYRSQLRQGVDDALHALVQVRLLASDVVVRHAAHDFVDLGDGALDRLKDLERMLVKDVERALDPVIGDGMLMAIVQPGRKGEQARAATPPTQPSSAAAVEWLIAERNALHIIS